MKGDYDSRHVDPLLPGYALDALDSGERHEVAAHLPRCPRCRREADHARAVAAQLAFAARRHEPPPALRRKVMARAIREGMRPAGGDSAPGEVIATPILVPATAHAPISTRSAPRAPRWLVAAAILPWLVAAALGALLVVSWQRQTPSTAIAVAQVSGAHGMYGWLTMTPSGTTARLMLIHMPPLPPDERYVCWLETDRRIDRACTFRPRVGRDATLVPVSASQPLGRYARITVTVEKGRPSPRRTGTLLATGSLQ